MTDTHLALENVSKVFQRKADLAEKIAIRVGIAQPRKSVRAVNDVSLDIARGEALGLVGESGCGKSTLGRIVAGIYHATTGHVVYDGVADIDWSPEQKRRARLDIQMVFQDPMASLNRRKRVVDIIGEAPVFHGLAKKRDKRALVAGLMREVGLDPDYMLRFPHQFSGGQRQRIGIARALALEPSVLVCDEAVAALDVSIQAQVLNLFMDMRETRKLTYLFISHDLGVVEHLTDRVAVMYLGRIVEVGPTEDIFSDPRHPYTQMLLEEAPRIGRGRHRYRTQASELPSPLAPPPGCHFHPRCPHATDICRRLAPVPKSVAPLRIAACHLNDVTGNQGGTQ